MTDVIVVSPHLDDAALSCGGCIARLVRSGIAVTAVTIFTADAPHGSPLSTLARRSHASWGAGERPFETRREEDTAALGILGACAAHLGLLDAVYRRSATGDQFYASPLAHPESADADDYLPRIQDALREAGIGVAPEVRVLCPAGTGGHVDHILARRAVEALVPAVNIVYYDEYPYSSRSGEPESGVDLPTGWGPHAIALTAEELELRIAAVGCYASQLRGLFPSTSERLREIASARIPVVGKWAVKRPDLSESRRRMAEQVADDLERMGGERYWWSPELAAPFPQA